MPRRRSFRRSSGKRRLTDWQDGFTTTSCLTILNDVVTSVDLWTPVPDAPKVTLVRIVGMLHGSVRVEELLTTTTDTGICSTLHQGIQVVPRAQGTAGTVRDPSLANDREGSWLHMRWNFVQYMVTGTESQPADWFIPMSDIGSSNPVIDVRVKRKMDLSQDALVYVFKPVGFPAVDSPDWEVSLNLRLLFMES